MKSDGTFISQIKNIPELDSVEYAIEAIGGSEALYEKTLRKMVLLLPAKIEKMEKFLETDDNISEFGVAVHGIKGSLRQLGCAQLATQAQLLENAAKEGNKQYCVEHSGSFREILMCFYRQVNELVLKTESGTENPHESDIRAFASLLAQAKTAAEDYDSIAAAEILSPLTKHSFGSNIDELIAKAVNMLDIFKPRQALEHITELLEACEKTS